MPETMPLLQAQSVMQEHPHLASAYQAAVRDRNLPYKWQPVAKRSAAYLATNGWVTRNRSLTMQVAPKYRKKRIKLLRSSAVRDLQAVGILPSGIAWLFVRWVILPFLFDLIKRWMFTEGT